MVGLLVCLAGTSIYVDVVGTGIAGVLLWYRVGKGVEGVVGIRRGAGDFIFGIIRFLMFYV